MQETREAAEWNDEFIHHVDNALARVLCKDPSRFELSEAVYNAFGNNLRFQQIFESFLIPGAEPLIHAFELWLLRGEYVITEQDVLVAQQPVPDTSDWLDEF